MSSSDSITVKRSSVEWLRDHYPGIAIAAGLCHRVAGRMYIQTKPDGPTAGWVPFPKPEGGGYTYQQVRGYADACVAQAVRQNNQMMHLNKELIGTCLRVLGNCVVESDIASDPAFGKTEKEHLEKLLGEMLKGLV